MKHLLKYISISLCFISVLTGCDDDVIYDYDTRKDEYAVRYNVTYSTLYDFHNIAYVSFTSFFNEEDLKYTGKPRKVERRIDGTEDYFIANRVPKGSRVEFSTYIDVAEALPNTKVEISIEVSKGNEYNFIEVVKAEADCPLKDNPLTISYDIPNK